MLISTSTYSTNSEIKSANGSFGNPGFKAIKQQTSGGSDFRNSVFRFEEVSSFAIDTISPNTTETRDNLFSKIANTFTVASQIATASISHYNNVRVVIQVTSISNVELSKTGKVLPIPTETNNIFQVNGAQDFSCPNFYLVSIIPILLIFRS